MKYLLVLFFLYSHAWANMSLDDPIFTDLPKNKSYNISIGSGVFINNKTALTSAHIVENCLNITIRNNQQSYLAKLFSVDKELDLALLVIADQVDNLALVSLTKSWQNLSVNKLIFIKSDGHNLKQSQITRTNNFLFEFSGNFEPGASGSPIFDQQLNLIGILVAKVEIFDPQKKLLFKTNQAVSINQIKKFVSNKQINTISNLKNSPKTTNNLFKIHCIKPEKID